MTKLSIDKAAELAGMWWAYKLNDKYKSKRTEFAKVLTKKIIEIWNNSILHNGCIYTVSDYDNSYILYDNKDILLESIKEVLEPNLKEPMFSTQGILPDKHCLNVYPDKLEPKEGYGNWTNVIYVIPSDRPYKL